LLIDEYDNSVNKTLGDTKGDLYQFLYIADQVSKEADHGGKQSLFRQFFSIVNDKFSRKLSDGLGRVFITGVSPIALNDFGSEFITTHITHYQEFEGICGIYDSEIDGVLSQMISEDQTLMEQVRDLMIENFNGYMFTHVQSPQMRYIFNPGFVIYFLKEFARSKQIPIKLIDPNIRDCVLKRPIVTIGDYWENARIEAKGKQQFLWQNVECSSHMFCVLRVGLYRLIHAKLPYLPY
jgi:hypothetical protein